jgi:hypothetical protein
MSKLIRFPARLNYWPTDVLSLADAMLASDADTVVCDGSALKWAMPIGLCGLAATCQKLHDRGQPVQFDGLPGNMANYFERMDVFDHCHVAHHNSIQRLNRSASLLELRCLTTPEEINGIANPLVTAITGQMMSGRDDAEDPERMRARPSDRLAQTLHYIISELLENALTHAQAHGFRGAQVWVAANFFPATGAVRIGVVDTGCGFLKSLERHERVRAKPTDGQAIATALEPYVSCNKAVGIMDDSSNQGIGLTVSAAIAEASGGWLEVNSGSASVKASPRRVASGTKSWQGAALDVCLSRDRLLGLDLPRIIRPFQRLPRPRLRFE